MKFSKYLVYFLFFIFCVPTAMAVTSCEPSYRNMRKFTSKKKRTSTKRKKSYSKQRRMKQRASRPINTSYVLKTKRRSSYHY